MILNLMVASVAQSDIVNVLVIALLQKNLGTRKRTIKRRRAILPEIETQLGPYYFRRGYRMNEVVFSNLVKMLEPQITIGRRHQGPNGFIVPKLRVSAALRYFAGGSVYDIMLSHGMSHSSVY